jgi:hypothetical protein
MVDPDLLEAAPPKPARWTVPLSGKRVARRAADGRVRDEMTLARTSAPRSPLGRFVPHAAGSSATRIASSEMRFA